MTQRRKALWAVAGLLAFTGILAFLRSLLLDNLSIGYSILVGALAVAFLVAAGAVAAWVIRYTRNG